MPKRRLDMIAVQQEPNGDGLDVIGAELRAARVARGEAVEDIAAYLRIRPHYLEALERGDAAALPARPYAIGFLRAYAAHLELDALALAARLKASAQLRSPTPELIPPPPVRESRRPTVAILVASLLLVGGVYGGYQLIGSGPRPPADMVAALPSDADDIPVVADAPEKPDQALADIASPLAPSTPTSPPPTEAPQAVAVTVSDPSPAPDVTSAVAAERLEDAGSPVSARLAALDIVGAPVATGGVAAAEGRVMLLARESSWVQVRSATRDFVRSRTLQPGESFILPDRADLALWTGNAGGVELFVDGQSVGRVGQPGAVVRDLPLAPESLRQRVPLPD
jgi:cytoskeleton protein RodZ